jgi:hypothetical protein
MMTVSLTGTVSLTMTVSFTGGRVGCTTGTLVGGAGAGVCELQPTNATSIKVATAIRSKRVWAFKRIMTTSPIAFGLPIIVVVVEWMVDMCDQGASLTNDDSLSKYEQECNRKKVTPGHLFTWVLSSI